MKKTNRRKFITTSTAVSAAAAVSAMPFRHVGQVVYQPHPVHLDFVKNYGHLWQKVVVYDAMEV